MANTKSTEPIVRALSVRQPYAEQILLGKKKFEYRSTNSNIRERVYLYASKGKVDDPAEWRKAGAKPDSLPIGVIVGTVEIVGSTFDEDEYIYAWKLARPERLATPLQPVNQPQPGVWRPQFAATPTKRRTPSIVEPATRVAPPSRSTAKPEGRGITGELVCYHNPDTMDGDEIWQVGQKLPYSAVSARRYEGAEGKRLWFVTGRGSPRRYFAAGWYIISELKDDWNLFFYRGTQGHVATRQSHLVEIGKEPWFKDLRRACANFATTQHVRDRTLLRHLELAWARSTAPR